MVGFFLLLLAADLSGRWSGKLELPKSPPLHVELRQTGERISGYAGMRLDFMTELTNVEWKGGTLSFDMRMPMGPYGHFEAIVEGDRMRGVVMFPGANEKPKFELARSGELTRLPESFDSHLSATDDLAALSDEFDTPESLGRWKSLSLEESLPNRFARTDAHKAKEHSLFVEPQSGAWWAGFHGGFLFKDIGGDFDVTARLKVTGKSGGEPENIWTISGLLVRAPGNSATPLPLRKENWLYLMTGRGPKDGRVVDAKSTVDSLNEWDILPAEGGWYELRIVRMGPLFVSFVRADGGAWTLRKRTLRPDLPGTLQVGLNFTCDYKASTTMPAAEYNARLYPGKSSCDSETTVDWVRFRRPNGPEAWHAALAGKNLVDVSDEVLLKLLGR